MRVLSVLTSRSLQRILIIIGVSLVDLLVGGSLHAAKSSRPTKKAVPKMIEAIVNRNKSPTLVMHFFRTLPRFPTNYDWDEQKRVLLALRKLYENRTEELWDAMVQNESDSRYSLTIMGPGEEAWNRSVGYFCRQLAYWRLVSVVYRHLPTAPIDTGKPATVGLHLNLGSSLRKWRNDRKEKALYQLQIEVCEIAIAQLAKIKDLSIEKRVACEKALQKEIDYLRKRKRPIMLPLNLDGVDTYTPENAKLIRVELDHNK